MTRKEGLGGIKKKTKIKKLQKLSSPPLASDSFRSKIGNQILYRTNAESQKEVETKPDSIE